MGPVGSSKSSACWMELFERAFEQKPNAQGVRRTRMCILRNTYSELRSTTIKTVLEWAPYLKMKWGDSPITGTVRAGLPDNTTAELEVIFIALERPEEVDKIGSLEITFAWANEVREIAKSVIDKLTERVGRFPPVRDGGPTWRGLVMDTNPPDDDSWYYNLAERADPELVKATDEAERKLREMGALQPEEPLYQFFRQPGGLLKTGDTYESNPSAENIANLDGGYAYYYRQLGGKRQQWINAQILGQYATTADGKPVYPEFVDEVHVPKVVPPIPRHPIIVGLDYGRSPAASFVQVSPRGQLRCVDEVWSDDMGIEAFSVDVLQPHIAQHYREHDLHFVGDPAGMAREADERNAFDVLAETGIAAIPAHTNKPLGRQEAVRHYLTRMVDGQPGLVVDPRCIRLRKGFAGRYYFRRVMTKSEVYKDVPEKNEYSHVHDALQYAALYAKMENLDSGRFKKKLVYPALGLRST